MNDELFEGDSNLVDTSHIEDNVKPEQPEVYASHVPVAQKPKPYALQLLEHGVSTDQLEKLMELQERQETNDARKAYHKAMAAFKANAPNIIKDKTVSFPTKGSKTEYHHSSLHNITTTINPELSKHGLNATWKTEVKEGIIWVTCFITHELGHSEQTSLPGEPDATGNKNKIQQIGSTVKYLQRYTLMALCGLADQDQDDDGQAAGVEYITDEQAKELEALANEARGGVAALMKFLRGHSPPINDIDGIPVGLYDGILNEVKKRLPE